jgi:hypothetical protein
VGGSTGREGPRWPRARGCLLGDGLVGRRLRSPSAARATTARRPARGRTPVLARRRAARSSPSAASPSPTPSATSVAPSSSRGGSRCWRCWRAPASAASRATRCWRCSGPTTTTARAARSRRRSTRSGATWATTRRSSGTQELRLDPARVSVDVAEYAAHVKRGRLDEAAALYGGPFLAGFHLAGAPEFDAVGGRGARALERDHARLLERLALAAERDGDAAAAAARWRALAAAEPLDARVAVRLMTALDAAGDRAGALAHARVYEALVRPGARRAARPRGGGARRAAARARRRRHARRRTPRAGRAADRRPGAAEPAPTDSPSHPVGAVAAPWRRRPPPRRRTGARRAPPVRGRRRLAAGMARRRARDRRGVLAVLGRCGRAVAESARVRCRGDPARRRGADGGRRAHRRLPRRARRRGAARWPTCSPPTWRAPRACAW